MPVGIVRIVHRVDALRMHRVFDIEQDPVAGAGASRQTNRRIHRDVVALIGVLRLLLFLVVAAAVAQSVHGAGAGIHEHPRAGNDFGVLGRRHWDLDDVDAEQRRIRILVGLAARASGQFFALAHEGRSRNINVNVVFVVGVHHQRVGVRSAAGLHGGHLLRILDIGDVENSDATKTFGLRGRQAAFLFLARGGRRFRWKSLRAAIDAPVGHFHRHEHQVFVDRYVALSAGADHGGHQRGLGWIGNIENIHSVEISLEQVIALESHVRVSERQLRDHDLEIFRNFRLGRNAHLAHHLCHFGIVGIVRPQLECVRFLDQQQVLQAHRRFARVIHTRLQGVARIVGVRSGHARRQRRRGYGRKRILHFLADLIGGRVCRRILGSAVRSGGGCSLLGAEARTTEHRGQRQTGQVDSQILESLHRFSSEVFVPVSFCSMPCMILISARWVLSASVAKLKISASCPAPAVLNRSFTIINAPL